MKRRWVALAAISAPLLLTACSLFSARSDRAPQNADKNPVAAVSSGNAPVDVRNIRRALTAQEASAYVGSEVCASCHGEIAADQSVSHHARTLRPVAGEEFDNYFRKKQNVVDSRRGITYGPQFLQGQHLITVRSAQEQGSLPAQYVIGAGHNAHTFFSPVGPYTWMDLRISYYTKAGKWDFTPGQRPENNVPFTPGVLQQGKRLTACLTCHVTVLRETTDGPDMQSTLSGIGCERCHGPGKAHVEALARGATAAVAKAALESLKAATPQRITEICGFCHQDASIAKPGDVHTESDLARFQAAALQRSKCYLHSTTLSCITCHDPHRDVQTDRKKNDAVCQTCHALPKTVCPVNPKSGCVRCHMPRQTIVGIPHTEYSNHWIKIWKQAIQ